MASLYRILLAGSLSASARQLLEGLDAHEDGEYAVITGDFDQAALHGVLARVRCLGLDLVEIRRVTAGHAAGAGVHQNRGR